MATVNETGTVQERYVYDAFGNVNGLASDWNRTFTGQVFDNETGLMLYRNRFYAPSLGRFLSRDPIGYEAEDENLYRYVTNSPALFIDPFGLIKPQGSFDVEVTICRVNNPKQIQGAGGEHIPCYSITYNPPQGTCSGPGQTLSMVQAISTGGSFLSGLGLAGQSAAFDIPHGRDNEKAGKQKYPDYQGLSDGPCNMKDGPNNVGAPKATATVCAKCTSCVNGNTSEEILGCINFTWGPDKTTGEKTWTGPGNPTKKPPTNATILTTGKCEKMIPAGAPGPIWTKAEKRW